MKASADHSLTTRRNVNGVVYFVRPGNSRLVKIGWSSNFKTRFRDLQAVNHRTLSVLLTIPGDQADEYALHQRFKSERRKNEWFELSDRLREFIDANGGRGDSLLVKARRLPTPTDDEVRAALDAALEPSAKLQ